MVGALTRVLEVVEMALSSLAELDRFKAAVFVPGYPDKARTFYSPVDRVHEALKALLTSATKSIVVSMYGYDDDELDSIIRSALKSDKVFVQMSLYKSQAAGRHEKEILRKWHNDGVGNSIAIGRSEHNAIMHLKMVYRSKTRCRSVTSGFGGAGQATRRYSLMTPPSTGWRWIAAFEGTMAGRWASLGACWFRDWCGR